MASIDNRIVRMTFDNASFERKVSATLNTLDRLKQKLNFDKSADSFRGISIAASKVDFSGCEKGVESLNSKLSTLGIVGTTALVNLTNSAINAGKSIVRSVIGPLTTGGWNRASNIEAAKFKLEGLGVVGKDLESIWTNVTDAVDGTAYSLDSAALVAAQLAASGMRGGEEMARSLRAISGVASVTGSSYDDIGRIFTQVAGQGKLMGDQLLQLSGRGMNAAATLAKELGKSEAEVRDMVSKGKIDFQTFADAMNNAFGDSASKANQSLSGVLSNVKSALAKIGADFFTPFITNTTTEGHVSNLVELFNAVRVAINDVRAVLGPLFEAIQLPMLQSIQRVTEFLEGMHKLSGASASTKDEMGELGKRMTAFPKNIVQSFTNIVNAITKPLRAIRLGFEEAFGIDEAGYEASGFLQNLVKILETVSSVIEKVTSKFVLSNKAFDNIATIVSKLVTIFRKLGTVISPIIGLIGKLAGVLFDAFTSIAGIGLDVIANGLDVVSKIVEKFLSVISSGIGSLTNFGSALKTSFLNGFGKDGANAISISGKKLTESVDSMCESMDNFKIKITETFAKVTPAFQKIATVIGDISGKVFGKIKEFAESLTIQDIINTINALSAVAGAGGIRKFAKSVKDGFGELAKALNVKGITEPFTGFLDKVGDSLQAWSKKIEAGTILQIAGAIGILAVSLKVLSTIDGKSMTVGIGGLTAVISELTGTLYLMSKINAGDSGKTATTMIKISIAVKLLVSALRKLSELSWEEIGKGLAGLGGMMIELAATTKMLGDKRVAKGAGNLILLAVAVDVLTIAVEQLSALDWASLGKGLVGVGGILLELAGFIKLTNNLKVKPSTGLALLEISAVVAILSKVAVQLSTLNTEALIKGLGGLGLILLEVAAFSGLLDETKIGIGTATSILIISSATIILAEAVKRISQFDWESIGKGLSVMAGGLISIATAARILPKGMITKAAGVAIMAGSMLILAEALNRIKAMSWEELGKGLAVVAGGLIAFAGAAFLMKGSLAGAAAMLVMSAALQLFVPCVERLGNIPLHNLAVAFTALGASFIILAAAGALIGPLTPAILGLSASLALAGAGIAAFSAGVAVLASVGTAGAAAVTGALIGISDAIPVLMRNLGNGFIELVRAVGEGSIVLTQAFVKILIAICDAIIESTPKLLQTVGVLLESLLAFIVQYFPMIVNAGLQLIESFLAGVASHIGEITTQAIQIVVNFVNAVADQLPNVIDAGINLIIKFIYGLAEGIQNHSGEFGEALANLALSGITAMAGALVGGITIIMDAVRKIGSAIWEGLCNLFGGGEESADSQSFAQAGTKATQDYANALNQGQVTVQTSGTSLAEAAITGLNGQLFRFQECGKAVNENIAAGVRTSGTVITGAFLQVITSLNSSITGMNGTFQASGSGLGNAFNSGLSSTQATISSTIRDIIQNGLTAITSRYSQFNSSGRMLMTQLTNGINSGAAMVRAAFLRVITQGLLAIKSKSSEFNAAGRTLVTQLNNGFSTSSNSFRNACLNTARAGASAARESWGGFYQAGRYLVEGFKDGIVANTWQAEAKARAMAIRAKDAAKRALDEHSPSKVLYEIGKFFVYGFANAIRDYSNLPTKESEKMALAAGKTIANALKSVNELVNEELSGDPVIRPVVDLTDVQTSAAKISTMLGDIGSSASYSLAYSGQSSFGRYRSSEESLLNKTIKELKNTMGESSTEINNTFNISGNDPKAIADEVSRRIQFNVERSRAVWGR